MIDFSKRSTEGEAMDDPAIGIEHLNAVFRDLNYTNLLLGGQKITLQAVKKMMRDFPKPAYIIADMGCGDGDMLRRLANHCRKAEVPAKFIGIDNSAVALEIATQNSANYPEISYLNASLLDINQLNFPCDILLCTLTLHHFPDPEIPQLLINFSEKAEIGVIVNDLQRNRLAYYLFLGFSLIFIKTKIAKQDGLISIRRGFHRQELRQFSRALTAFNHTIRWCWVFRYLWVMQTKGVPSYE